MAQRKTCVVGMQPSGSRDRLILGDVLYICLTCTSLPDVRHLRSSTHADAYLSSLQGPPVQLRGGRAGTPHTAAEHMRRVFCVPNVCSMIDFDQKRREFAAAGCNTGVLLPESSESRNYADERHERRVSSRLWDSGKSLTLCQQLSHRLTSLGVATSQGGAPAGQIEGSDLQQIWPIWASKPLWSAQRRQTSLCFLLQLLRKALPCSGLQLRAGLVGARHGEGG